MRYGSLLALLGLLLWAGAARALPPAACQAELQRPRPAIAHTLAALAQHEHAQMGGALIAADGGLIRSGFAEAERAHRPGAKQMAWQRVWNYWRAAPDFYRRHLAWMETGASTAERRVALIDQAWSAAFISWLMREAGLNSRQFAFSAAHHHYVRAAMATTEAEAAGQPASQGWRACDLAQTPPRLGDLLCFARGADRGLEGFAQVRDAVGRGAVAMHCELVVTQAGSRIQLMGGNVLQTVVLRELELRGDGSGLLWPAYVAAEPQALPLLLALGPTVGDATAAWPQTHLSQQPWSVLLQMRAAAWP